MTTTKSTKLASLGVAWFKEPLVLVFTLVLATLAFSASPALAGEAHPFLREFGHNTTEAFSNPNGIAVEESTGDVYVADIGTDFVYKFNANGEPVNFNFPVGSKEAPGNTLEGADTPAGSFSFPSLYGTPAAIAVDNACVQHSPALTGKACEEFDPSAGDVYVMDSGHGVIDKFSPEGRYLSQIGGFPPSTGSASGELLGLGVDGNGTVHVDVIPLETGELLIDEFDGAGVNLIARQEWVSNYNREFTGLPGTSVSTASPSPPRAMTTRSPITNRTPMANARVRPSSGRSSPRRPRGQPQSGRRRGGGRPRDRPPLCGRSVLRGRVGHGRDKRQRPQHRSTNRRSSRWRTLVARFGSLELSGTSGEGGIAVDGATGDVYVSNAASGKVYVFASDVPAVTAGEPTSVTKVAGSLSGTVDPRGVAVSSCEFQWGVTDEYGNGIYNHSVPCKQTPAEIGAGSSPVAVSAQLEGLKPGELYHFRLKAVNASGPKKARGLLATQGEGFGIKSFEVSFLNENGTPDTQAGSHPYQFVNTLHTELALRAHRIQRQLSVHSPARRRLAGCHDRSAPRLRRRPRCDRQEVHRTGTACVFIHMSTRIDGGRADPELGGGVDSCRVPQRRTL